MDKIEVSRDHLLYLIRELGAVRKDKQDLASRVGHVHACLSAMAGVVELDGFMVYSYADKPNEESKHD